MGIKTTHFPGHLGKPNERIYVKVLLQIIKLEVKWSLFMLGIEQFTEIKRWSLLLPK